MGKEIRHKIGSKIKSYRKAKGLTQAELSEVTHVKYKYVQQIEGKNPPNLRVDTLQRIASGLKIPVWKLLQSSNNNS